TSGEGEIGLLRPGRLTGWSQDCRSLGGHAQRNDRLAHHQIDAAARICRFAVARTSRETTRSSLLDGRKVRHEPQNRQDMSQSWSRSKLIVYLFGNARRNL